MPSLLPIDAIFFWPSLTSRQIMQQSNLDGALLRLGPIAGWRGDNLPHAGLRLRLQGQARVNMPVPITVAQFDNNGYPPWNP